MAEHLVKFLPSHSVVPTGGEEGITAVFASPYGNALLLPITYGYIKMLGADGLRRVTEMAIVNANYMAKALEGEFRTYYTGENGRVGHEMILDLQNFRKDYGVEVADIARRLMDYGFHAPTLSFPVHDTLMVEPTESESKEEMDRFMEALVSIKRECEAIENHEDNVVVNGTIPIPGCRPPIRSNGYRGRSSSPTSPKSTTVTATGTSSAPAANSDSCVARRGGRRSLYCVGRLGGGFGAGIFMRCGAATAEDGRDIYFTGRSERYDRVANGCKT